MNDSTRHDDDASLNALPQPQGLYRPVVLINGLAFTAGMTPRLNGQLVVNGLIGLEVGPTAAADAARLAANVALNSVSAACGGPNHILQCVRMTLYLACAEGFSNHSAVADHASAVLYDRLGDRGLVARSTVGVASLPGGAPLEIDLVVAFEE